MVKLIFLWAKTKRLKWTVITTPLDVLRDKFVDNPGGVTLMELGQLNYMAQELGKLSESSGRILTSFGDLKDQPEEKTPPEEKEGGFYL